MRFDSDRGHHASYLILWYNSSMGDKIINFINKTLSTRITPLAYVYALQGLVFGVAFTFFQAQPGVQNTILFKQGALIGISAWGLTALIASAVLIFGMLSKSKFPVQIGALGMFMAWIFAGIVYFQGGYVWFLLPLAILNVLCYGYYYLAAALNQLWDYTP